MPLQKGNWNGRWRGNATIVSAKRPFSTLQRTVKQLSRRLLPTSCLRKQRNLSISRPKIMQNQAHEFGFAALSVLTRDTAPNPARMRRETLLLDGVWSLSVNDGPSEPVLVPFVPQAKINKIVVPPGEVTLSYSTSFELPVGWAGGLLHFEGIDHEAEVILNGQTIGRHVGAYDPFALFVPASVLGLGIEGGSTCLHVLTVLVRDSSSSRSILSGKQERKAREGCIFYANMSGIWKSVWLEQVGPTHVSEVLMEADSAGNLHVAIEVSGVSDAHSVALSLTGPDGTTIHVSAPVMDGCTEIVARVTDVRPWSIASPDLYFGTIALLDGRGKAVDSIDTYVGFRDVRMRDGYYRLNDEPFFFQGLLNQAVYPDTLYTPTDAHTLTDLDETRRHGFNGERRHQTTPRHRDLWLADKAGYWLSIELPCARDLSRQTDRDQALMEWRRILRAYAWNHPCVFFLVPGNENWGLLTHPHHEVDASDEERELFQYELGRATEAAAPRHLPYAANDGWRLVTTRKGATSHGQLDPSRLMFNIHDYTSDAELRSTYGSLPRFPAPGTWGTNASYVFHSEDYSYDGHTPMILSEVGGRALLGRPSEGVFAYGTIYSDPEAWAAEISTMITLLGSLPVVRGGYVLTQTRDAGNDPDDDTSLGELNGILDGYGSPKHAGDALGRANEAARRSFQSFNEAEREGC